MTRQDIWLGCLTFFLAMLSMARLGVGENPVLIGALTDSWGPTPAVVGLHDGLIELGYRENEHFFLGVRFTQGDTHELPEAAQELVEQGVNVLFT
jgi:hypothetical protein